MTAKRAKVERNNTDLVAALRKHVQLLREYYRKAFEEGDSNYLGEIAGKLRVLVYRSRTCHPLLLDLMKKHGIEIRLPLSAPGNRSNTIDEYLNRTCGFFTTPDGRSVDVRRIDIISTWAQQIGASHEDTAVDEEFSQLLSQQFFVQSRQIAVEQLRLSASFVLAVAEEFLGKSSESEA